MKTRYPGVPRIARAFWGDYLSAVTMIALAFVFTAAAGAIFVFAIFQRGIYFYLLGVASLIVHLAAMAVMDVWRDRYDPGQTTFSSFTQVLATIVVLGAVQSTILLVGTGLALISIEILGSATLLAAVLAAYYPVADIVLTRRGIWTPGGIVFAITVTAINTVFGIHKSVVEGLPIMGRRRRPQS